jgi:hypothetical protein
MKVRSRIAVVFLLALLALSYTSSAQVQRTSGQVPHDSTSLSGVAYWQNTTGYPVTSHPSCVASGAYVYCVGGASPILLTNTFYANLSSSGVSAWKVTANYPTSELGESCVVSGAYIYCVGGADSDSVFYAQLSSSGISSWSNTTGYPRSVGDETCVTSRGYIYCVGGGAEKFYYAQLSSSGVSSWNVTARYPASIQDPSCVASGGYIYCVGGEAGPYDTPTNAVFYAALSSSGVSTWTAADQFPMSLADQSCVASNGYIY